jgi:hypothetical protein
VGTSGTVANDQLHLVHWTWDATLRENRVYVDEQVRDMDVDANANIMTATASGHIGNAPNAWGPGGNTPNPILGMVDEVWVSTVARSQAWIETAYNNQHDAGAFYTVGAELPAR